MRLCEMNETDAEFFFELNNDPDVIQFTGDDSFRSVLESRAFIQNESSIHLLSKLGFQNWVDLHTDLHDGVQGTLIL